MTVAATKENWTVVMEAIEEFLDSINCPLKAKFQILTASEEIYVNIASYAYVGKTGEADIELGFDEAAGVVSISFADSGVPYNPLEKEDADTTLSAEERKIGGLGILMVKKSMDDIKYEYSGGKNHLQLIKKCC
ncbi:ATP-binding protein [Huintestinicola sp.]|uniref:ATP-binding protein n=1 Tax=Huintestinicola sp. TaxID=2981661 RepID=UPI003D7ECC02